MKRLIALMLIALAIPVIAFAQENDTSVVADNETILEAPGILPDSPFYGLGRAFERIQLALTFDVAKKAELRLKQAEKWLAELQEMERRGKPEFAKRLSEDYSEGINETQEFVNKSKALGRNIEALETHLNERLNKHLAVLQRVREQVPEQAWKGIDNAINNSQRNMEKLQERIEERIQERLNRTEEGEQEEWTCMLDCPEGMKQKVNEKQRTCRCVAEEDEFENETDDEFEDEEIEEEGNETAGNNSRGRNQ